MCPRVPVCAHRGLTTTERLRLCGRRSDNFAARAVSKAARLFFALSQRWSSGNHAESADDHHPVNDAAPPSSIATSTHAQYLLGDAQRSREILGQLHELLAQVHCQSADTRRAILRVLEQRLLLGSGIGGAPFVAGSPNVLYFVGDNGVGKTHVARTISLAWSLHCDRDHTDSNRCEQGDSLLWLSGTGFAGTAPATAGLLLQQRVCAHAREYPYGIVLLDDVSALPEDVVPHVMPLLGAMRSGAEASSSSSSTTTLPPPPADTPPFFSECPTVILANLLVIMTTDFGSQRRGAVISDEENLMRAIPPAFQFSSLVGGLTIVPFRSWSLDDARVVVRSYVHRTYGCGSAQSTGGDQDDLRNGAISVEITAAAVEHVLDVAGAQSLLAENGHALMRAVRHVVDPPVLAALEDIAIDEPYTALFIDVADDGGVSAVTFRSPVEAADWLAWNAAAV